MNAPDRRPSNPTWHQRRAAARETASHWWIASDDRTICVTCGLDVPGDPDDVDDLPRCEPEEFPA